MDGGSRDGTLAMARKYMSDGDVKLIELPPGLGLAKALNEGMAAAGGEFIARMDADDIAYPSRLQDQVQFFVTHPDVSLVGTGVDAFWLHEGVYRSPLRHDDIVDHYLINNPFYHPTIMFRRELYESGLLRYDENQPCDEDYELWARVIPRTKCANMDQSSIRYRLHAGGAQWDPRKHRYKRQALQQFTSSYGIGSPELVEALVQLQCSGYIRPEEYVTLKRYAQAAEDKGLPKLGWLHPAILKERDYLDFTAWFRKTKAWTT